MSEATQNAAQNVAAKPTSKPSEWFRLRRPRLQCRHILASGVRCGSPALRDEAFCYYHHSTRKPIPRRTVADRKAHQASFELPTPEDGLALQVGIGEVLRRIAANEIDRRRAGLLLYGLQIASSNLQRLNAHKAQQKALQQAANPATGEQTHVVSQIPEKIAEDIVEEIVHDPIHGDLAPEAELPRPEDIVGRTPQQIQHDRAIRQDERERFDAQLFTVSLKLRAEIQTQVREEETTRRRAIRLARQHAELMARIRSNRQLLLHDGTQNTSHQASSQAPTIEELQSEATQTPEPITGCPTFDAQSHREAKVTLHGEGHEPRSPHLTEEIPASATSPSTPERPMLKSASEPGEEALFKQAS